MALVQQKTGNASAVTSVSLAFDSDVTAGNHIIDLVSWYDTSTPNLPVGGITDTQSNTHTIAIQTDTTEASVAIGYAENVAAGATTVTIDPDNTGLYFTAAIVEWSGLASSGSLDKITSNTGTSNSPSVGPTATLSQADEVIFALAVARIPGSSDVGFDVPATTGYTNIYVFQDWTLICSHASDYKEVSNTAGQSAAWGTLTSASANWAAVLATFKVAPVASSYGFQGNAFQFGQYIGDGGPAGIDGELDQNIGNITLSATGQVVIRGTGTGNVIGAVTSSATGRVEIEGVGANNTIGAVTLSATGDVDIAGSADITIGAITSSATGTVLITGVGANNTIDNITVEATGVVGSILSGELDQNIGDITLSATGQVEIEGVASNNVGDITLSSTGIVEIHGSASATVGAVTVSATGRVDVAGALSKSIGDITVSATGGVRNVGVLGSTIEPVTLSATGTVLLEGVLDKTIGDITVAATGVIGTLVTGQLNTSIGIFTVTATGNVSNTVRTMGASVQAGSLGGGLQKRAYSKSRFRQENMKWPSRG